MGFGTILKLQKFLSRHNLELLDVVLTGLVNPRSSAFQPYWREFSEKRGGNVEDVTHTVKSLQQLQGILREYLAEMR